MNQKTTMADIARLAGVSASAVSFALNGREGVSPETRKRILAIASDLGWFPNAAARALTGARVSAVGLVLTRPPRYLGVEPFFMNFVAGLQSELGKSGTSLLLHITEDQDEEISTYRRWAAERRVDGLVLLDLKVNDIRPSVIGQLGLPAVVVGDPQHAGSLPAIWTADAEAIKQAVRRLVELGHTQFARVSERSDMAHTSIRTRAFFQACAEHGLPAPYLVEADPSDGTGRELALELLRRTRRPTIILFDVDLMAVAALGAIREIGLRVPEDVSLLTYDDSLLCEVTQPPLTALNHDVYAYGSHTARVLMHQFDSKVLVESELDAVPALVERGSTGPWLGN